jgi:hypothetical protein
MPRTRDSEHTLTGHAASCDDTKAHGEHVQYLPANLKPLPIDGRERAVVCLAGGPRKSACGEQVEQGAAAWSCQARGQAPCMQRRRSAAGLLEGVGADLVRDAYMATLFEHLRHTLHRLRSFNDQGRAAAVRWHALSMRQAAAVAGCLRLGVRAERVASAAEVEGHVMREALDDLELEMDAAEALWRAAGWVV